MSSWICQTCLSEVPDGVVLCLFCMERKQARGLREQQREFLRMAYHGRCFLTTRRVPKENTTHLQIFGGALRTFCGDPVTHVERFKGQLGLNNGSDWRAICPKCVTAMREILDEVLAAERVAGQ